MNINTNQANNFTTRRIFVQNSFKDNRKAVSATKEKGKNANDNLVDNVKKMIEEKKKQIKEVEADDSIPDKLKEIKLDILNDQLTELEKQLNQAIIDQQKRDAEELVRQQMEKSNKDENKNENVQDTKIERFVNTFSKVAYNFDSIQQNRILKAEKDEDLTRIEIEMKNDAERGIIGDKADDIYKTSVASIKAEKEMQEKISDTNDEIEKYREEDLEAAQKPESEKSNDEKLEEDILNGEVFQEESSEEKVSEGEVSNNISDSEVASQEVSSEESLSPQNKKTNSILDTYSGNSFENYIQKKSNIDTNC